MQRNQTDGLLASGVGGSFRYSLGVGALVWVCSMFLASPSWLQAFYGGLNETTSDRFHDVFVKQVENPFYRPYGETNKCWENAGDFLGYRIFVPILAWASGVGPWGGIAIIWLAGALASAMVYDFLRRQGVDGRLGLLFVLALGTTPFLQGSNFNVGFPDSVAWCCAAIMIRFAHPACWALATFVGLFNDERLLVALPLAAAVAFRGERRDLVAAARRAFPCLIGAAVGVMVAIAVRHGIKTGIIGGAPLIGNPLPADGGSYAWSTFHTVSLVSSYAFLWVLPFLAAWRDRGARVFWGVVLAYSAVAVFVTTYAADFWRGLGAIYPLFMLAFVILAETSSLSLRRMMPYVALLMLLRPQFFSTGTIKIMRPLPVALYELWVGESILADIKSRLWPQQP